MKEALLSAARAEHIPAGASGLWYIVKKTNPTELNYRRKVNGLWRSVCVPPGLYTRLLCFTEATIHVGGDLVMHDTQDELETHLDFMLKARGHVLITGLGLGCVARGCLANPAVERVTLIERDRDVLRLVAPYMPRQNLTIIQADAMEWARSTRRQFDCAWHDLWDNPDKGDPKLPVMHAELLTLLAGRVKFQGAWAFPKLCKRQWERVLKLI